MDQLQELCGRIPTVSNNSVANSPDIVSDEDCDITASPVQACYNCIIKVNMTFFWHSKHPTFVAFCDEITAQTVTTLQSTAASGMDLLGSQMRRKYLRIIFSFAFGGPR
ncbi:hypothetical protein Aduo_015685 [Ancylostoma duodenale]